MKSTGTIETATGLWNEPNEGATNISGFSGIPGGFRTNSGDYGFMGEDGFWWSSSDIDGARFLNLGWFYVVASYGWGVNQIGSSVRCLRD